MSNNKRYEHLNSNLISVKRKEKEKPLEFNKSLYKKQQPQKFLSRDSYFCYLLTMQTFKRYQHLNSNLISVKRKEKENPLEFNKSLYKKQQPRKFLSRDYHFTYISVRYLYALL